MTDGDGPTENEPPPAAPSSFIAAAIAFWRRVRERKVAQWGAGYIVAAFGLMQGFLLITETFDWPAAAGRIAFAAFAAGFPIVLIIAWSHGERGRQRVTRTETGLIAACVAVGGLMVVLAARVPAPNGALPPLAEGATVAVLPFTSLTNQEDDVAFAAGLHDDLLNRLAQVGSMQVIGRTSVQSYRDTSLRINQIAAQLDADIVLEGSVQRSGERVRVSVQAIDGESESQRWAESYDRELTVNNLFDIQREITEAIAGALDVVLTRQEIAAAGAGGTRNLQAFEANARGRLLLHNPDYNLDLYRQAQTAFDEAVLLDPNFATAYAGKARALMSLYWMGAHDPALRELARAALDRAEALAPNAFETQEALAYYFYWGFLDYRQATIHIDRALEAAPNNADAWSGRAYILRRDGRFNEAVDAFDRAMRLDPRNQLITQEAAVTLTNTGHFARAQTLLDAQDQSLPWVRRHTSLLRLQQGDVRGAWMAARDLNQSPALDLRFYVALCTRDPANINFALADWPIEARRPDAFPEAYEVARVEALLALGRQQEARALLLEVSARLNASANPYPGAWSNDRPTPARVPGLLGDLAGVRAAERDYLNAPRDEWAKNLIYWELALAFLRAGDRDRAMHYLEQEASLFGPQRYLLTSVNPRFDSLRDHRRYRAYRARYEAWAARPR